MLLSTEENIAVLPPASSALSLALSSEYNVLPSICSPIRWMSSSGWARPNSCGTPEKKGKGSRERRFRRARMGSKILRDFLFLHAIDVFLLFHIRVKPDFGRGEGEKKGENGKLKGALFRLEEEFTPHAAPTPRCDLNT